MHRTVRGQRPRLSFGWCVVGLWTLVCLDLNVGSKLSYAGATDTKGHKNRHGKPGHDVISKPSRHLHAVPTSGPTGAIPTMLSYQHRQHQHSAQPSDWAAPQNYLRISRWDSGRFSGMLGPRKQERLKFSSDRKKVCESFGCLADDHGVRCNLVGGFNGFARFTNTCP